jgi:hypothetical protein
MRRRVQRWTVGQPVPAKSSKRFDKSRNGSVVGLDLSLTGTACVSIPLAWTQDLSEVRTKRLGYKLKNDATPTEKIERMITIADGVIEFCTLVQARHVYLEDHAFGAGGANANQTIEMTGIVKGWLRDQWGVTAIPVHASSARKTLLQHVLSPRGQPKGWVKKWVANNVRRLGGPILEWTEDEIDAFVIANHALMIQRGMSMSFLGE